MQQVVNVGAGTGSYEPMDRLVVAVEPSVTMIRQRTRSAAPVIQAYAEKLPLVGLARRHPEHATRGENTSDSPSPKGFNMTHTHRRFPVTDVEAGITAGFVNFNGGLPDVHMFKIRNGKIEEIQAVFGGNAQGAIWPDESR